MRVYANDHLPPHFHVVAPDFEVLIEIVTLAILAGSLPAAARRAVMPWIEADQSALAAEWSRINPRFPVV